MKKILLCLVLSFVLSIPIFSDTLLGSNTDDYLDALVLMGKIKREYLHVRTYFTNSYSNIDSVDQKKSSEFNIKPVLPNISMSYNYYDPNEGNDGSAWQGKGFNIWGYGGIKSEWKGFSASLIPQFWFAQNKSFPLMNAFSTFDSEYAYFTGSIDLPQRFGDEPIYKIDMGESELRYSWNHWTIGFGTQSLWIGPVRINPVLFSNNAAGFPKLDIGLLPLYTGIGNIEFRIWWGQLRESDYFDNDSSNDNRFVNGFHLAFAPKLISGFTIGVHRIILADWNSVDYINPLTIINPVMNRDFGYDVSDQRASITFNWLFPEVNFEVYGEWGKNDYSSIWEYILLSPEHSQAYTIGGRQAFSPFINKNRFFVLEGEISNFIHTRDYEIGLGMSQTGFYTHHIINQGHTNDGQLIGPQTGPGSDVQTLKLNYYWPKGKFAGFFQRIHVNKDYIYGDPARIPGDILKAYIKFKAGFEGYYNLDSVTLGGKIYYLLNLNYNWIEDNDINSFYLGFSIEM
jgi:hypothetical protein